MPDYLFYDLHIHTYYSSCSTLKPKDILKLAYKKNLDGIAVVDHNTWNGSREVYKLNKKLSKNYKKDFEVVIGSEIETQFGHMIVYYQNEPISTYDCFELIDKAKEQDALVSIPHPFRTLKRLSFRHEIKSLNVNAIEGLNGRTTPLHNKQALNVAKSLNIAAIGGSDAHFKLEIGNIATKFKHNLRHAILHQKTIPVALNKHYIINGSVGSMMSLINKAKLKILKNRIKV